MVLTSWGYEHPSDQQPRCPRESVFLSGLLGKLEQLPFSPWATLPHPAWSLVSVWSREVAGLGAPHASSNHPHGPMALMALMAKCPPPSGPQPSPPTPISLWANDDHLATSDGGGIVHAEVARAFQKKGWNPQGAAAVREAGCVPGVPTQESTPTRGNGRAPQGAPAALTPVPRRRPAPGRGCAGGGVGVPGLEPRREERHVPQSQPGRLRTCSPRALWRPQWPHP